MEGWIKLHRKFCGWEWFNISEMVHLFIYLLINANHEDGNWRGISIKRGQIVTGRNSLSENTGISSQTIRTCLSRLKSTNEITIKSTNKYSIITITKYDDYQGLILNSNQQTNQPTPNNQPATNQQLTTNKNNKNEKKEKKEKKYVGPPTLEEVQKYFVDNGYSRDAATKAFNYYSVANWCDSNGKPVLSWKQKMITVWFKDENLAIKKVENTPLRGPAYQQAAKDII